MRIVWLLAILAFPAHADLYRWIDPESGSVKISSLPPSDPTVQPEVVRYTGPAGLARPAPPAGAPPTATASTFELESRWRALLAQITGLTPEDFNRGGEGLRQQIVAYEAVRTELDRLDPAGAARRRTEAQGLLERLRQGASR